MRFLAIAAALFIASPVACAAEQTRAPAAPPTPVAVDTIAIGLAHPWGLQFLPDGRMIVTERPGKLRVVDGAGHSIFVAGVPAVAAEGQGGLLDIALAPDFAASRSLYVTFAEPRGSARNATSVARGRLVEEGGAFRLEDVRVVFRQEPATTGGFHFGSRLAFARDGRLFVTLGERYQRDFAQDLSRHWGKVVRIDAEGGVPDDNPFVGKSGALPEIWSFGHRNPQAAAIHPQTGELWMIEHGARGGDEINISRPGRNYGWPVITYGRDYSGAAIGIGTAKAGMEQPIYYWDPSIAPSGMAFYTGDLFRGWKGSLLVGALAGQALHRLVLDGDRIIGEERLLVDLRRRIRDVRQAPDGSVVVLTDHGDGQILRLRPPPG